METILLELRRQDPKFPRFPPHANRNVDTWPFLRTRSSRNHQKDPNSRYNGYRTTIAWESLGSLVDDILIDFMTVTLERFLRSLHSRKALAWFLSKPIILISVALEIQNFYWAELFSIIRGIRSLF